MEFGANKSLELRAPIPIAASTIPSRSLSVGSMSASAVPIGINRYDIDMTVTTPPKVRLRNEQLRVIKWTHGVNSYKTVTTDLVVKKAVHKEFRTQQILGLSQEETRAVALQQIAAAKAIRVTYAEYMDNTESKITQKSKNVIASSSLLQSSADNIEGDSALRRRYKTFDLDFHAQSPKNENVFEFCVGNITRALNGSTRKCDANRLNLIERILVTHVNSKRTARTREIRLSRGGTNADVASNRTRQDARRARIQQHRLETLVKHPKAVMAHADFPVDLPISRVCDAIAQKSLMSDAETDEDDVMSEAEEGAPIATKAKRSRAKKLTRIPHPFRTVLADLVMRIIDKVYEAQQKSANANQYKRCERSDVSLTSESSSIGTPTPSSTAFRLARRVTRQAADVLIALNIGWAFDCDRLEAAVLGCSVPKPLNLENYEQRVAQQQEEDLQLQPVAIGHQRQIEDLSRQYQSTTDVGVVDIESDEDMRTPLLATTVAVSVDDGDEEFNDSAQRATMVLTRMRHVHSMPMHTLCRCNIIHPSGCVCDGFRIS
jgi:hypothetical protein